MTLYRDMTSPQLAEVARGWEGTNMATYRLLYALSKRLEQEYQRANQHRDKLTDLAQDYVAQRIRTENLELELAMACTAPAGPGYIKVAKPHISLVGSGGMWPSADGAHMWYCAGCLQLGYGPSPGEAYAAWRRIMEQSHSAPADAGRFRFNYMRKD